MTRLFLFTVILFVFCNSCDARDNVDSLENVYSGIRAKSLIMPSLMIVSGGLLSYSNIRKWPTEQLQSINNGQRTECDNYLQFMPHLLYTMGGELGLHAKNHIVTRSISLVTSSILSFGISRLIKHYTWENRPGNNGTNSFPSGHTATAFTGAELARIEYGKTVGIVSYCIAGTVGILRLSNNKHWVNDVIAGAGIGILSARLGVYIAELEYNLFSNIFGRKDKSNKNTNNISFLIIPHYEEDCKSGVCVALCFSL